MKNLAGFVLLTLASSGLVLSLYLSYVKATNSDIVCGFGKCEIVQKSEYSYFLGVPVAYLGVFYYLFLFILGFYAHTNRKMLRLTKVWAGFGVLFSAYLTYLEIFAIEAICAWCVLSALIAILAFLASLKTICYDKS